MTNECDRAALRQAGEVPVQLIGAVANHAPSSSLQQVVAALQGPEDSQVIHPTQLARDAQAQDDMALLRRPRHGRTVV